MQGTNSGLGGFPEVTRTTPAQDAAVIIKISDLERIVQGILWFILLACSNLPLEIISKTIMHGLPMVSIAA